MLKKPTGFTTLNGHYGLFKQKNNTIYDEDKKLENVIKRVFQPHDDQPGNCHLRFMAMKFPASTIINKNQTHFDIYGYSYSVAFEAAGYLNCR